MRRTGRLKARTEALRFLAERPDAAFAILKAGGFTLHDGYAWAGLTRLSVPAALVQAFARGVHELPEVTA